jgi:hypothetical protein
LIYIPAIKSASTARYSGGIIIMLIAVITKAEESRFIALNPEIGITTQGETYQETIHNLNALEIKL